MNTRKTELPAWAEKYHTEGTTLRKRGNAYMLLRVSSRYVKDRPYPVLDQEYLGMVDEAGFHPKKRSGSGVRFVEWYAEFQSPCLKRKNHLTPEALWATMVR